MRWWRRLVLLALTAWGLLLAMRCHLPRQTVAPSSDSTSAVYLVRHGWHAGLAVRRADVPNDRWPVLDDFPDATYLEVGWGEARYYPGEIRGVWGAVRAGAWPTGSVLHVVPVADSITGTFPQNTIVRIPVSRSELNGLIRYVAASFADTGDGTPLLATEGFYPGSRFYRSGLTYHVFNNCNHWAAGALEAAGCDTAPRWTLTVGRVIEQAQRCGTLVQQRTVD
jgi:uncharacterized protein (TIGR02117 family)